MRAVPPWIFRLLLGATALLPCAAPAADPVPVPLTTAASVLKLTGEDAGRRLPIAVTGVVTAAEPDWNGQFFVQDATGGVFVENFQRPAPVPGDVVAIEGVSHPGAFAPIISAPHWRKIGTAPLPEPRRVPIDDLQTGGEDGQRVEVEGVVRTARFELGRLVMDVSVLGQRLQVQAHVTPEFDPAALVAARVRARGTAATHYIGVLRHLTSVAVYVPRLEDFTILARDQANPFDEPVTPVNALAQYRRRREAERRLHIRGVVTLQRPGVDAFIQDDSGGIRVVSTQPDRFGFGDDVEAVGFLEYENHLPLLRDAVIRRVASRQPAPIPRPVQFHDIVQGEYHGEFITLRGRVLDRSTRTEVRADGQPVGQTTTWVVQGADATFTVEYAGGRRDAPPPPAPPGSVVDVDGVCQLTIDATGKVLSVRLLLGSPEAIRIVARPSWITPSRLLAGLGIVSAVLVVALAWLLTIAKKNAALRRVVRELEQARENLQEAHDTLEEKVAERSAQLQVEMTARKTAELEFKAVLTERTRLARDLHDTLEQTLAGIALRLNTAAKLARRDPDGSEVNLQFARNWLHQSQVDLRRSIWDLRSRELEEFDLASALRYSAEQVVEGTDVVLDFQTTGQPAALPEVVEENILRIAQEALTNLARHARARAVRVLLEFAPEALRLRVEDDGVGFDSTAAPQEGHFGLTGMAERARRISGRVVVTSRPGQGTTIVVEIPLHPEPAPTAGSKANSDP
ncbi:MAG TPA: histidine kinase [Opitutaceae bacterium]|nr:histidine kinase [Opitutaceae bacterium]